MIPKPESCRNCWGGKHWGMQGYIPPSGSGTNGVLLIGEAAGEHEALEGMGFVGKAGSYLFQNFNRVGIEREGFRIDNIIKCQPYKNLLSNQPFEAECVSNCHPFLMETILDMKKRCEENNKTFTILTMGKTAFKAIMGFNDRDPIMQKDYISYPFWNNKYGAWVVPTYHPSYLMRGNTHLVPVMQFGAKRALEIAEGGFKFVEPNYLLDPSITELNGWIDQYERDLRLDPTLILSYDIETPMKQGEDEEDVAKEDDDDYTILRCSFSYKPNSGVSARWDSQNMASFERIFGMNGTKCGWNSTAYDRPRILKQMPINGDELDGMLMWHVLNSALPKGLGFVSPYYNQFRGVWKYLSDAQPALYNAIDADTALQNVLGIKQDLIKAKLWDVFQKHVVEVHKVFNYMSEQGVLIDQELRSKAELQLTLIMSSVEEQMEGAVPKEARKFKLYKKQPKDMEGVSEVDKNHSVKYCGTCGLQRPNKAHAKVCPETKVVLLEEPTKMWARPLEFKVSKLGLSNYQKALKHQAIISRKEGKVTFDEKAIIQLVKKHPKDPLYPLILQHRKHQKLLSNYIGITQESGKIKGGLPIGPDGRVHCNFTSNPSTLRSACQKPNLQNQPRPDPTKPDDPVNIIRNLFRSKEGSIFTATDFSGIEAKIVGYLAGDPDYMRLCSIDVHSFYTAYAINALDGRIKSHDLPLLAWSDERLASHLANIKKEFKSDRNNLYKHLVHACNFGQKANGAQEKILLETGTAYPVATIKKVQGVYYELFPKIPKWQWNTLLQVEKEGYLRNPYGYVHRFTRPFDYEKFGSEWQRKQGVDANKIWAFGPQSTAAGIIKEAMLRLYHEKFEEVGQYLRLLIHDELFAEVPKDRALEIQKLMEIEMAKPILQMPLPESFNMGPYFMVGVESKMGERWGSMKG